MTDNDQLTVVEQDELARLRNVERAARDVVRLAAVGPSAMTISALFFRSVELLGEAIERKPACGA